MDTQNPYAATGNSHASPDLGQTARSKNLWFGYLIAPAVVPSLAAAAVLFGGLYFVDPDDTGTPIGIVALPILLMTVGMVISYLLMLAIGMPIAFFLQRRNLLNGYTIHAAAIVVSILFTLAFALIMLCMWLLDSNAETTSLDELPEAIAWMFCAFGIFALPTAAAFWLVACKLFRKSPPIEHTDGQ